MAKLVSFSGNTSDKCGARVTMVSTLIADIIMTSVWPIVLTNQRIVVWICEGCQPAFKKNMQ